MDVPPRIVLLIAAILASTSSFSTFQQYCNQTSFFSTCEQYCNRVAEYSLRFERISLLMSLNLTDYETAALFDDKYNYMADDGSYNRTVLEFFNYWRANSSLASLCLNILQNIKDANRYLSGIEKAAINLFSREGLALVLSVYTDKEEYVLTGGEEVKLTICVLSNKYLGDVDIEIFGFKSPYRGYAVKNRNIDSTGVLKIIIRKGFNSETFSIGIPCSPCYGIQGGLNNLTCVIKYTNLSLSATKTFLLKSGS